LGLVLVFVGWGWVFGGGLCLVGGGGEGKKKGGSNRTYKYHNL